MSKISIALTAIMLLALVAIMAPNIIALNRGKILRNAAIWLAIFALLGLFYQNFGSGKMAMPSLSTMVPMHEQAAPPAVGDKNDGSQGFTPPRE